MKIESAIESINLEEIVLPEFQREYVWDLKRAKELFISLLKDYPVGGILIWKTNNPPALKNLSKVDSNNRTFQVLLDGQQRLTTLYMLISGKIPPYYNEEDVTFDPRELAFNLETREFNYWKKAMKENPRWQLLKDCFLPGKIEAWELAQNCYDTFKKLKHLIEFDIRTIEIPKQNKREAYSQLRDIFRMFDMEMFYGGELWKILIAGKTISFTFDEMESIHYGFVNNFYPSWRERNKNWSENDREISIDLLEKFWKNKVIAPIKDKIDLDKDLDYFMRKFNKNYQDLNLIKSKEIPVQIVPMNAQFSDAVDIFDKINSQGQKLSEAELALTHVTAKWGEARMKMKDFSKRLKEKFFDFNLNFLTRALCVVTTERALYAIIHPIQKEDLIKGWNQTENLINYIISILKSEGIESSSNMSTPIVLIPILLYLKKNNGEFGSDKEIKSCISWLVNSMIWQRYSTSVDSTLETDLNVIKVNNQPWSQLIGHIKEQRGRVTIQSSDFKEKNSRSPVFIPFYNLVKNNNAMDWFNGLGIGKQNDNPFKIHIHHIFPKSFLLKNGYELSKINEIANFAFITAPTNLKISDKSPEDYLPQIIEKYPEALKLQFIPEDKELWKIKSYELFLEERRGLIAKGFKSYFDSLSNNIKTIEDETQDHLNKIILLPENERLEFKETWAYNIRTSENEKVPTKDTRMQLSCIKTIAALMNSNGGDLIIGMTDDNEIEGLARDLLLVRNDSDKLERNMSEIISNSLGIDKKPFYNIHFKRLFDDKLIAHIVVKKNLHSKTWVNFSKEQDSLAFVRDGNQTKRLSSDEFDEYWNQRQLENQ